MRPIRFRAWFREEKVMRDVRILSHDKNNPDQPIVDCDTSRHGNSFYLVGYDVDLMQFTGLHDKNGKEIWEGDIIGSGTSYPLEVFWMGLAWGVRWNDNGNREEGIICDDGGDMEIDEKNKKLKHMEVLGNIYENPELLK